MRQGKNVFIPDKYKKYWRIFFLVIYISYFCNILFIYLYIVEKDIIMTIHSTESSSICRYTKLIKHFPLENIYISRYKFYFFFLNYKKNRFFLCCSHGHVYIFSMFSCNVIRYDKNSTCTWYNVSYLLLKKS